MTTIPEEPMSIAEPPAASAESPIVVTAAAPGRTASVPVAAAIKIEARGLNVYYGSKRAVRDVDLDIPANAITLHRAVGLRQDARSCAASIA